MFDLQFVVMAVVFMLVCAGVLGLLWFLIGYWEGKVPSMPLLFNAIRLIFVTLVVLLLIFMLLALVNQQPLFRWGPPIR